MEDCAPGVEIDAVDRVAQQEAPKRRLGSSSHDFEVWFPAEFVIDEDSKVAD